MSIKQFEITKNCPLKCSYCYNVRNRKNWEKDISLDYIKKNVSQGDIVLIGGGEPFLNKQIVEITNYLAKERIKNVISTSGIFYKPVNKASELQISLQGISQGVYKKVARASFEFLERTLGNIKKFKNEDYKIGINFPVYEGNFKDLEKVSDFCDSLDLHLRVRPIINANGLKVSEDFIQKLRKKTLELILKDRDITFTENFSNVDIEYHIPNKIIKYPFNKNG